MKSNYCLFGPFGFYDYKHFAQKTKCKKVSFQYGRDELSSHAAHCVFHSVRQKWLRRTPLRTRSAFTHLRNPVLITLYISFTV